jgi:hypothetical protein
MFMQGISNIKRNCFLVFVYQKEFLNKTFIVD